MPSRRKRCPWCAFGLILFFTPVFIFLYTGISAAGFGSSFANFDWSKAFRTLGQTITQATLSALPAVIIALPGAFIFGRLRFPGSSLIRALSLATFILPSIVVVIAIIGFWGRSGILYRVSGFRLFNLYGLQGIVLAHVFFNCSFAVRIIGDAWERISHSLAESASIDGAGPVTYAVKIVVPLLAPAILTAFVLVFMFSFLSFGIVYVFGGLSYATVEVRIFQELYTYADSAGASWYAIVQLLFTAGFIAVLVFLLPRIRADRSDIETRRFSIRSLSPLVRFGCLVYALFLIVFIAGPLISIIPQAGLNGFRSIFGVGIDGRRLQDVVGRSFFGIAGTSVLLASASASIAFVSAYVLAKIRLRGRYVELFAQLPLGVSLVSFALGLRAITGGGCPYCLVILTQGCFAFPVVYRVLATAVAEFPGALTDAARLSGASPVQIARYIEFPVLKRSMLTALGYALAIPFADFTAVLTIARGRIVTFPIAIHRMLGFRNLDGAFALGFVYIVIVVMILLLTDRLGSRGNDS